MASVQERLQLKRMPLENWSISEQLYLASAVACSGDQNWMSVSRQLRQACGNNRPSDWFSQKSCAAQYEMLLENVEPTKRKKRNEKDTSQATVETPIELIVRKLTLERIGELQKLIQEERDEFQKMRNEIAGIQNNVYDESQLREMLLKMENEEKQREREKQKYDKWLKEREERKKNELERQARTNPHQSPSSTFHASSPLTQHLNQKIKIEDMEVDEMNAVSTKQGTSPLLTSLLKSPSAAPNPSPSLLHNLTSQARVSAPTITNLLTGSVSNLSSSLVNATATASVATGVNKSTIPSPGASITTHTVYTSQLHNHPLTGPPSNHDQMIGNVIQSPSQAAPTLSMLLENKQKEMVRMPSFSRIESQNAAAAAAAGAAVCTTMAQHHPGADTTKTEPADADFNNAESPIKDEDQNLLEVFNELIPDDIGELADIILDDLINEEQVAAVSQVAGNLDGQVNLDLKNFQSQSAQQHTNETAEIKEEPIHLNENNCDSTVRSAPKIKDPFDALKEQKDPIPFNNIKNEKKIMLNVQKDEDGDDGDDDDSDLSNDTPLSELIKQEASAKQQRSQASTPKDISSTIEQPDDMHTTESNEPAQYDRREQIELDGDKQSVLVNKMDNSTHLLENRSYEHVKYVESTQKDHINDFNIGKSPVKSEEKPTKIEITMPIDSFESDSNDEKSMENIKREIEALPELKDSNSSENSQDEKIGMHNTMGFKENPHTENTEPVSNKLNDNSVCGGSDQMYNEKFDTIDLVDTENEAENEIEPVDAEQPATNESEKDEQVKSNELKNESMDLTENKNDSIGEQNESTGDNDVTCDKVEATEKSEPIESEKIEIMDTDESQGENGEASEKETQEEQEQSEQGELQEHQQEEQLQTQQHHNEEEEKEQQQQQQPEQQLDEKEDEKEEEELQQQQHQQEEEEEQEQEPEQEQQQQENKLDEDDDKQSDDSTAGENLMDISSDEMPDKDDEPSKNEETKDEIKAEADSSQADDADDRTEVIENDDQKPDPTSSPQPPPPPPPEENPEKSEENAETSIKTKESNDQTAVGNDSNAKSPTPPKPTNRKNSTDDELFEDAKDTPEIEVKPPPPAKRITTPAITTCDTDDDSVIEVVKEEKVGTKRDYSRRKKDYSHSETSATIDDGGSISSRLRLKDRDRSESPFIEEESGEPVPKNRRRYSTNPLIDSPNSPASSDDRDYRSWKKSIVLLYGSLAGHRCASIFAKPITDEQAPNYSQLILQPMDLQSLKRNIDSGQIRNILDFQVYVMRMCYNAIFYNINDDVICARAKEMLNDALQQIAEFSVTWEKESKKASSASSTSSNVTKSVRGRKSNRLMN